jgi:hypothetical protein
VSAFAAVVRVGLRIAATPCRCGRRGSPTDTWRTTGPNRASAHWRSARTRCTPTRSRAVLNAHVVATNQNAVTRGIRIAGAAQIALRATRYVVALAASATNRHRASKEQHQHSQSLVQPHRMNPFPCQRPEAFHAPALPASASPRSP